MRFYAKTLLLSFCALCFTAISAFSSHADTLVLNGSAVYQNLTRDYYIGGLYLPTRSDDINYILAPATAKRMQLVIQVPSWPPRRWTQIWQNNIAINNDDLNPNPQLQQALMEFTSFPRQELKAGDELIVDYQPNGNSRVLLNGDLVLEVPGTDFFNYMVNTWIGKLPPTREFKQQILGQEAANAAQQNLLLTHQTKRPGLFAGWLMAELAVVKAAQEAAETEKRRLAQAAQEERQKAEDAARAAEAARQQRLLAAQQTQVEEEERQRVERARQQQQKQEQAIKAQTAKASQQLPTSQPAPTQILAQEQRYYLSMLQWQLQRQVEATVSYPAWAKQFNQEGLAIIDFRLNRQHEISEVQIRDESVPALLNTEVQRAATAAVEKLNIPTELAGDSWPVSVRYQFSLQSKAQPSLAMPQAPASLQKNTAKKVDLKELEDSYRQQQITRIQDTVIYPPGARILKKQDQVSIEADIDYAGNVIAIRDVKSSRHRELNQALQDAVKKAAPFPPLPLELNKKQLTLEISYNFKL